MGVVATFLFGVWVFVAGVPAGVGVPVVFGSFECDSWVCAAGAGVVSVLFGGGVIGVVGSILLGVVGVFGAVGVAVVYVVWNYGKSGWCCVEAAAVVVYVSVSGFEAATTHLTWWGMGLLGVYDVSRVAGVRVGGPSMFVLSSTVAVGVIAMSMMECELLGATHTEYGDLRYIGGNWAVHYYPLTRVLFDWKQWRGSPLPGVGFVAAYAVLREPGLVYGCFSLSEGVIRAMLVGSSLVLAGVCAGFRSWCAHRRDEP
jgi:hypothetical protein